MSISGDDMPWLEKVIGVIGTAAVAIISGSWFAASKTKEMEMRLAVLEEDRKRLSGFCMQQKEGIVNDLRNELCAAFQKAIGSSERNNQDNMSEIRIGLAVLAESNRGIKEDVSEIFMRMNRRRRIDDPLE